MNHKYHLLHAAKERATLWMRNDQMQVNGMRGEQQTCADKCSNGGTSGGSSTNAGLHVGKVCQACETPMTLFNQPHF